MALPELNKLSDAEYKLLTQEQLMMYNKEMPKMDYDNQYSHQPYPKAKYQLHNNPDGSKQLVAFVVRTREAEDKLTGDWRDTPKDWGVITHPGINPEVVDAGYSFTVPLPPIEPEVSEALGEDGLPIMPEVEAPQPEAANGPVRAKARG